jgi:hypothetical protein
MVSTGLFLWIERVLFGWLLYDNKKLKLQESPLENPIKTQLCQNLAPKKRELQLHYFFKKQLNWATFIT